MNNKEAQISNIRKARLSMTLAVTLSPLVTTPTARYA
jgi:hypothetical protein